MILLSVFRTSLLSCGLAVVLGFSVASADASDDPPDVAEVDSCDCDVRLESLGIAVDHLAFVLQSTHYPWCENRVQSGPFLAGWFAGFPLEGGPHAEFTEATDSESTAECSIVPFEIPDTSYEGDDEEESTSWEQGEAIAAAFFTRVQEDLEANKDEIVEWHAQGIAPEEKIACVQALDILQDVIDWSYLSRPGFAERARDDNWYQLRNPESPCENPQCKLEVQREGARIALMHLGLVVQSARNKSKGGLQNVTEAFLRGWFFRFPLSGGPHAEITKYPLPNGQVEIRCYIHPGFAMNHSGGHGPLEIEASSDHGENVASTFRDRILRDLRAHEEEIVEWHHNGISPENRIPYVMALKILQESLRKHQEDPPPDFYPSIGEARESMQ
jgi:hypothetical protein